MDVTLHDLGNGFSLFRGLIAGGQLTFNAYLIQDEKTLLMTVYSRHFTALNGFCGLRSP